jgi:hypothetical protein
MSGSRNDLLWADVEHERGPFGWSRYDAFVADARHSGLTPGLILEMGSEDVTVAAPFILERASATACSMHNLDLPVPVSIRLTSRPSIEKIR